jgi:hypothetical protein
MFTVYFVNYRRGSDIGVYIYNALAIRKRVVVNKSYPEFCCYNHPKPKARHWPCSSGL